MALEADVFTTAYWQPTIEAEPAKRGLQEFVNIRDDAPVRALLAQGLGHLLGRIPLVDQAPDGTVIDVLDPNSRWTAPGSVLLLDHEELREKGMLKFSSPETNRAHPIGLSAVDTFLMGGYKQERKVRTFHPYRGGVTNSNRSQIYMREIDLAVFVPNRSGQSARLDLEMGGRIPDPRDPGSPDRSPVTVSRGEVISHIFINVPPVETVGQAVHMDKHRTRRLRGVYMVIDGALNAHAQAS